MKFTLSWLKDHLDTRASVAEIASRQLIASKRRRNDAALIEETPISG